MPAEVIKGWGRRHWFYLLLPLWLLVTASFCVGFDWRAAPAMGEAISLFDWCLFMPALYAVCYRRTLPARSLLIRTLAIACSGFWIAGLVVPDPSEHVLRELSWLRNFGLGVLVLIEVAVIAAMLRAVFSDKPDAYALHRLGIPPILTRLMLAEARFWRWVWSRLRQR